MASCTQYALKGFGQECQGSASGLKRLLIGLEREWEVVPSTSTSGAPHNATLSATTTGTPVFYEYFIAEESTSLTSTLNINNQNGVKYYQNVVAATFIRMRPEKHLQMQALANEKLIILVQDSNGQYWVFNNASASAETAQSGLAADDLSGYQIELSGRTPVLPYAVATSDLPQIDEVQPYN